MSFLKSHKFWLISIIVLTVSIYENIYFKRLFIQYEWVIYPVTIAFIISGSICFEQTVYFKEKEPKIAPLVALLGVATFVAFFSYPITVSVLGALAVFARYVYLKINQKRFQESSG